MLHSSNIRVIQPYIFQPEADSQEEFQGRLQLDVSEWLCFINVNPI